MYNTCVMMTISHYHKHKLSYDVTLNLYAECNVNSRNDIARRKFGKINTIIPIWK